MTNTTTKTPIQILRDVLTDEHAWLKAERKAISKGCGSSWDIVQCDERMRLIDDALRLTEGAQDAPGEPFYWLEAEESARGADPHDVFGKDLMLYSTRLSKNKPSGSNPCWPLYLHHAPKASTEPGPGCTRSHPHEDMDAACEAKTVQARADFKRAGADHAKRAEDQLIGLRPEWTDPAKRAEGELALFEATFGPFEFRRDYDKYGPTEAAFAVWQARGQQQAGVPDGWISVEDRLPEIGQHVVAFRPTAHITEDPPICITFYRGQMKRDWQDVEHGFDCLCHPSHWMPIPAAPGVGP